MAVKGLRDIIETLKSGGENVEKIIEEFMYERSALYRFLGLNLSKINKGYAEVKFNYRDELARLGGMIHGGVIMTVIDHVAGLATMTVNEGYDQVTLELKVNFLKPLSRDNSPFVGIGKVIKAGRRTIVSEGKILDKNGDICAYGIGTWYVISH